MIARAQQRLLRPDREERQPAPDVEIAVGVDGDRVHRLARKCDELERAAREPRPAIETCGRGEVFVLIVARVRDRGGRVVGLHRQLAQRLQRSDDGCAADLAHCRQNQHQRCYASHR
jgi:hypothetical protein